MSPCLRWERRRPTRLAELLPALTHQANPVDTGRPGETFTEVLAAVGADPAIDLLAVYALLEPGAFDLTAAVGSRRRHGSGPTVRRVVVATGGPPDDVAAARRALAAAGVAAYDGVAGAVTGVRALVDDARARAARADAGPAVRLVVPEAFTLPVGEDEGKRLLTWLGIATPSRRACDDRADAHAALARLGGPVVVKMLEPVVLHKARVGGVRLGVRTGDDLDAALDALDAAGARRYLVEETAPPGLDLIVGARRDPVFGPVVLLGLGGDLAEELEMVVVRPAPLSEAGCGGDARRGPRQRREHRWIGSHRPGRAGRRRHIPRCAPRRGTRAVRDRDQPVAGHRRRPARRPRRRGGRGRRGRYCR